MPAPESLRANTNADLEQAWQTLSSAEQQRITFLVDSDVPTDTQTVADELMACGNLIELQGIKSQHGDVAVKAAWKLLPLTERDRIKAVCDSQPQTQAEIKTQPTTEPQPVIKKSTLIELTTELQQLDDLLETIDGDNIPIELQQTVDALLAQRDATQEAMLAKLDNYAALIQNRAYWAATRKAEADRLTKLAESDMKTVDFLKGRLKTHLEGTVQKKVRTERFNISVRTAGGKQGLMLNLSNPKDLPERFRRVIIEADNTALREALEADDPEAKQVAYFAERATYLAIN